MSQFQSYKQSDDTERIPRILFGGLFIANMAAMMGMGILLPLLSPFAKRLGASETIIGLIFAGFALSRAIFSPIIGRISDRYGRKIIMSLGLLLYAILPVGYILLNSLIILAVLWLFQGIGSAMVAPIAQSYLGDITPKGKEGRIMNLFYLGQFGGIAIGPVLGGYLTDHVSYSAPFYVMIATSLVALGVIYFIIPAKTPVSKTKETASSSSAKDSFINVLKDKNIQGILYYMMGRGFYRWGFNALFPIYAITVASLSMSQVGLIITCYMIAGAVLQYPCGRLADRWADKKAELIGIGGSIAALTMLVVPFLHQLFWLIILMIVMGAFSALSRASTVVIRTKRGRLHGMGAVTGVYIASFSSGQVIGPFIFGAIADIWNISLAFYIGAAVGLLTTIMTFFVLKNSSENAPSGKLK